MFERALLSAPPQTDDVSPASVEALKAEILRSVGYALLGAADHSNKNSFPAATESLDFHSEVRRFEIHLIEQALIRTGGKKRAAARLLGMKPPTLLNKIRIYNITVKSYSRVMDSSRISKAIDIGIRKWQRQ